ncbi:MULTISPECIES: hypothetical protein [unclassified Streptomyces]|uniref:hypothetical protein n=1 Tax=unclassified Streptomyces TaxID=2593676 RepID=UPI0022B6CC56|nr:MULTISPECIES: hypothetical protein [unclassified Streptomyces]MCZ7416675.1 hypothetical protein [Streptomyces sp. WMMC897]MCZ7433515.1 hypothetical protein [Streptomyces sp. WMMC1477]
MEYEPRAPRSPGAWDDRSSAALRGTAAAAPQRDRSRPAPARHGPADPVRALLHQHRKLCERAVHPLEIAAALEAHGINDRAAARYRHRDVFALAEEMFARAPGASARPDGGLGAERAAGPGGAVGADGDTDRAAGGRRPAGSPPDRTRAAVRGLPWLLPGLLAALVLTVPVPAALRWLVLLAGALLCAGALRLCLRGVPLGAPTVLAGCWLTGYALFGDGLLRALLEPGTAPGPAPAWVALSLACAVAPAAGCAQRFAASARRRLAVSRSLGDFAARVRPALAASVALCALALLAVQAGARSALTGAPVGPGAVDARTAAVTALGLLFLAVLLLAAHGFPRAAALGLGAACAAECLTLGVAAAARLPGLDAVAEPLRWAVAGPGPAAIPALACALACLALLGYAATALTGASAHRPASAGGAPGFVVPGAPGHGRPAAGRAPAPGHRPPAPAHHPLTTSTSKELNR